MKPPIEHKSLLIYGYALPVCGALLVAIFPAVFDIDSYLNVVKVFQKNISLAIGVIALSTAVSIPFQVKVFAEDNEIVLHILEGTEVRKVFMDALHYQVLIIIMSGVILLLASTLFPIKHWVGFILLFCSAFVSFESVSMISNGRAYADLREKIVNLHPHSGWHQEAPQRGALTLGKPLQGLLLLNQNLIPFGLLQSSLVRECIF
jgi:hypothetical protein